MTKILEWPYVCNSVHSEFDHAKADGFPAIIFFQPRYNFRPQEKILKQRGFPGLYAGLTPTLVEIVPYAGLQFGTYDTFKHWVMEWNHRSSNANEDDNTLSSFQLFICGLAVGTCAKAVFYPIDMVKKRFQVEGLLRDPRYGALSRV